MATRETVLPTNSSLFVAPLLDWIVVEVPLTRMRDTELTVADIVDVRQERTAVASKLWISGAMAGDCHEEPPAPFAVRSCPRAPGMFGSVYALLILVVPNIVVVDAGRPIFTAVAKAVPIPRVVAESTRVVATEKNSTPSDVFKF